MTTVGSKSEFRRSHAIRQVPDAPRERFVAPSEDLLGLERDGEAMGARVFQTPETDAEAIDIEYDGLLLTVTIEKRLPSNVNRPHYCYARQVDYISGCSIALPTKLWRELGGFDRHYTPAYAEDADICQRVLARGLEVWLQPTSCVVHYEGKTSGTSTSGGVKAYQIINLKKLLLRWRSRFETHRRSGEAPFFEKERSVRKRVLFVDAVTPTPNQDAGSVQTVLGLRCGLACGYKTHFVPEDNWLFVPDYTPDLQRMGIECAYAPFEVGLENYSRRYGWLLDVI